MGDGVRLWHRGSGRRLPLVAVAVSSVVTMAACANDPSPGPAGQGSGTAASASAPTSATGTASSPATATATTATATATATQPDSPTSATGTAAPATVQDVERPVRADGAVAAGYTVETSPDLMADCSFSVVSKDPGVYGCGSTAQDTPACWPDQPRHRMLCLDLGRPHTLLAASLEPLPTGPWAPEETVPLTLTLDNGELCLLRIGGAGSMRPDHPDLVQTYDCRTGTSGWTGESVWATKGSHTAGLDTHHATWTVLVGRSNGPGQTAQPPLLTRTVTRAEYVGVAR